MTVTTKYDFFIVEPLLIYSDLGRWTHPEITELLEKHCEKDDYPTYMGPLVRFHLDKEGAGSITVVALLPIEGHAEKHELCYQRVNEDVGGELVAALEITLDDDVWFPGGARWCITRYGHRFKRLGQTSEYLTSFSPDVGVHRDVDGVSWTYSS